MYKPVFLFGYDRSGTTLLSMMVGAHPNIAVPFSVAGMWFRYEGLLKNYNYLETDEDVKKLVKELLNEDRINLWNVELDYRDIIEGIPVRSYASVVRRFHECYAEKVGKKLWGNIDNSTLYDMDKIHSWFPDARFIHIVRDGRDVALSHKNYKYGTSNIGECATQWVTDVQTNLKMGSMLGSDQYFVVRYEDLILDSLPTLNKLCDFLEVEHSEAMLEYTKMVENKIPKEKRFLWPAINQPPQKSRVYRWKLKMSENQRIVFESTASDLLRKFNYEVYESLPKRLSAYILELWYFMGRGHRFERILNKIGLGK